MRITACLFIGYNNCTLPLLNVPFPRGRGRFFFTTMKFSREQLQELTSASGETFAVSSLDEAFAFCQTLARSHYENFPVGSFLIPRALQPHFFSVYAFSRIADDIADELTDVPALQSILLDSCEQLLEQRPLTNPVFLALHHTMQHCAIPTTPFRCLLSAFRDDIAFCQPRTWEDALHYCSRSANPIGELVLRIFGLYSPITAPLSNEICTGLQLANFWQDISVDRRRGRVYIPHNVLAQYDISSQHLLHDGFSANLPVLLAPCLEDVCTYTESFFNRGENLLNYLTSARLRLEIAITIEGGRAILRATRQKGGNIVRERPTIRKGQYGRILLHALKRIL